MAFNIIDSMTPKGTDVMKTVDDSIRNLKSDIINNFQEISGYPNLVALVMPTWTTDTRPTTGIKNGIFGYNSALGGIEKYNGSSWDLLTGNSDKLDNRHAADFVWMEDNNNQIKARYSTDKVVLKVDSTDDIQVSKAKLAINIPTSDVSGNIWIG